MLRSAFAAPALLRTFSLNPRSVTRHNRCARTRATMSTVPKEATQPTIFDKIIAKEIAVDIVYEDDQVLAFHDINPQAPVHCLIIPKRRIAMLSMATLGDKEILGTLLLKANIVAQQLNLADGYRILINNGPDGLQSVYHIHLHIVGGRKLKWGPF